MKLQDYIKLKKNDIISFVGAGGKTTMMFKLAGQLRDLNKVLVTTTTKIYYPLENEFDYICTDKAKLLSYTNSKENGIYVLGIGVNESHKILGLGFNELDKLTPYFDYILIEADGAKEKRLKAWKKFEPLIYERTTKTIGIIDIQSFGMIINEENVHRSKIFCGITGSKEGETVNLEHLTKLIMHPEGLFKSSRGEKILYINKVEGSNDLILARSLISKVNLENIGLLDNVFFGSLKTDIYFNK